MSDRIRTISGVACVARGTAPTNVNQLVIRQISDGIAEKLVEHHKVARREGSDGDVIYSWTVDIIVPPTPEGLTL